MSNTLPDSMTQAGDANEINLDALLHQYFLQIQGGSLYPERIPVSTMERVLDIGCGGGEWIFELAKRSPKLHMYGIDANEEALHQAKIRRNIHGLRQIELRHMDLLHGLPIPDKYVDFVHMRRFSRFVRPDSWPNIIEECVRVLRPNGWLTIVELELCEISSPAVMTLHHSALQARAQLGRSLDASGMTLGVAQRLYGMMLDVGLDEVNYELHTVDLGFMGGTTARIFLAEIVHNAFVIKPLVIQQGILEANEFDELVEQAHVELQAPDLCGWAILLSAYGRRGCEL